jgi:prepilin peptidase CpaA
MWQDHECCKCWQRIFSMGFLTMLATVCLLTLPLLMLLAAANDVASMQIPNWLTALIAVLFFPMAYLTGMPLSEFWHHALVGVVLFFAGYVMFALRLFGGGDAKLMAAAGLWFGTAETMSFLFYTAVAGGVLALAYVLWSMAVAAIKTRAGTETTYRETLRAIAPKLPYGCALAAGAILAFPASWWADVGSRVAGAA